MKVYDCNLTYGFNVSKRSHELCETMEELCNHMKNAGLTGGLVRAVSSDTVGVNFGNDQVAAEIKDRDLDLWGAWSIVPSITNEIPSPEEMPKLMAKNKIGALYMNPEAHRFLAIPSVMRDYLTMADKRKIPIVFNTAWGISINDVSNLMEAFPTLTCILAYHSLWPNARTNLPFLSLYPNLYLDTSYMLDDQGIEYVIGKFGADRLIHGSGFPELYIGQQMPVVKCADISDKEKEAILHGNFEKLMKGADLK